MSNRLKNIIAVIIGVGRGIGRATANAYCFLASNKISYINRHALNVDGGIIVQWIRIF